MNENVIIRAIKYKCILHQTLTLLQKERQAVSDIDAGIGIGTGIDTDTGIAQILTQPRHLRCKEYLLQVKLFAGIWGKCSYSWPDFKSLASL